MLILCLTRKTSSKPEKESASLCKIYNTAGLPFDGLAGQQVDGKGEEGNNLWGLLVYSSG